MTDLRGAVPLGGDVPILERSARPVLSITPLCQHCGTTGTFMVPWSDIIDGVAGFVYECEGCGCPWAVGVTMDVTYIVVGKPTRELAPQIAAVPDSAP